MATASHSKMRTTGPPSQQNRSPQQPDYHQHRGARFGHQGLGADALARRDGTTAIVDVSADRTDTGYGALQDIHGTTCRCELVADRQGPFSRLGKRLACQIQRVVETECRTTGNVGGCIVHQVDNRLELVVAGNHLEDGIFGGRSRGRLQVNASPAANDVLVRIVEDDTVNRHSRMNDRCGRPRGRSAELCSVVWVVRHRLRIPADGIRPNAQVILGPTKIGDNGISTHRCRVQTHVVEVRITTPRSICETDRQRLTGPRII